MIRSGSCRFGGSPSAGRYLRGCPRVLMPSDDHPALAAVDALRLRLDELGSAIETARPGIRGRDEVADLSRAAVALDRAERALADIDSDVRIARSLFAYATGEWRS